MSIEQRLPAVLIKKTQMSSDPAQCGLSSLLPMSCRGRAEAFARRLHTRLRSLGAESSEASWLAARAVPPRDHDFLFDFDLQCASPPSPAEPADARAADAARFLGAFAKYEDAPKSKATNGDVRNGPFDFSTAYLEDDSPVKQQPAARENGHADKRLYRAISLEDCERRLSQTSPTGSESSAVDETDAAARLSPDDAALTDSDFESARSDISEPLVGRPDAAPLEDELPEDTNNNTSNKDLSEEIANASNKLIMELIIDFPPTCEPHGPANGELTPEIACAAAAEPASPATDAAALHVDGKCSDEEPDDKPQRLRRCSSLKTGKTPPGTPGRKKIVRFADVLGLDLADVKTFMDEIPIIPKSAYEDLRNADFAAGSPPTYPAAGSVGKPAAKYLVPMFQQPKAILNVADLLHERQVCLESASVAEGAAITICGSVRVRNLDFHKSVHVRYTLDNWRTYTDQQASYVPASCDGFSDKFQFLLYAPSIRPGQKLQFAVRFQCKGCQYWDNNSGANYCYQCLPQGGFAGPPSTVHPMENWDPSFY